MVFQFRVGFSISGATANLGQEPRASTVGGQASLYGADASADEAWGGGRCQRFRGRESARKGRCVRTALMAPEAGSALRKDVPYRGYLARMKTANPLGPPEGPRHDPTVGS